MQAFFVSLATVFLGEMGDKTQLLSILLATRFRQPWVIIAGIFIATLANHTAAGAAGAWLREALPATVLLWGVALWFIVVGLWALRPDKVEDAAAQRTGGALAVTIVSFFLAEIGDKTQIATAVLAARFDSLAEVVAGTTLGMLLADAPVVLLGSALAGRIPLRATRVGAAAVFIALGVMTLIVGLSET